MREVVTSKKHGKRGSRKRSNGNIPEIVRILFIVIAFSVFTSCFIFISPDSEDPEYIRMLEKSERPYDEFVETPKRSIENDKKEKSETKKKKSKVTEEKPEDLNYVNYGDIYNKKDKTRNTKGFAFIESHKFTNEGSILVDKAKVADFGILTLDDRLLVIVDSCFGFDIGDGILITLDDNELPCIVAGNKSEDGNLFDLVCSEKAVPTMILEEGDFSILGGLQGNVKHIKSDTPNE